MPGSFAWRTCIERWPRIVDALRADVPEHEAALAVLRDEVRAGVVRVGCSAIEGGRFGAVSAFEGQPWTSLPWYLGESFLYARIREAVRFDETRRDPFLPIKLREEAALKDEAETDDLADALWRSLWGNRADLSLPSASAFVDVDASDLVADDRAEAEAVVAGASVVGVLLDNAGLELWRDLRLVRLLRRRRQRVILFAKDVPFFVSDATPDDIARTRARGASDDAEIVADAFFTGPAFLTTAALPAHLRDALAACDVVIAKGDCNYRRLVGDAAPAAAGSDEEFGDVVDFPSTVVALRTLKAEVLVGADPARVAAVRRRDVDWLVSGRCGLVQVAKRSREFSQRS